MADSKISALPASTLPLAGTEVLPIVQSGATKKVATDDLTVKNVRSNATTGLLQVAGPASASTRVMTTPDSNFTVARTDADQTFNGNQTINSGGVYFNGATKKYYAYTDGSDNFAIVRYSLAGAYEALPMRILPSNDIVALAGNFVVGTAGKGIDFSADGQAAGMTSELLDDYEEGTWTPTIIGTSTAGTASYGAQSATYTKIGRMVYFQFELSWNSGTGTGFLRIDGLPFTCGASNCSVSIGDIENVVITSLYIAGGAYVGASSTQVILREFQVGGGGNEPIAYDAAGTLRVGGCYFV
jgi:hypothetical protein